MKKNFLTPIVALAVASAALLPSCTKEEYNLDDISDNIMFNTSLAAPIIAEREISFIDFFDMDMAGKFSVSEDEAKKIRRALSESGQDENYLPDCLDPVNLTIDLSKMNGLDLEKITKTEGLNIEFEEEMPSSEDFIEIDDLDKTFGDGNAINEIDEMELKMEIDNKSDFQLSLSIQFAKTITTINANGEKEELHIPIEGTTATAADNSTKIVVPARKDGELSTGVKPYTLTFKNIAKLIKDNNASGLLISYDLAKGEKSNITINPTDGVSMSLKAYISATIDLSNF